MSSVFTIADPQIQELKRFFPRGAVNVIKNVIARQYPLVLNKHRDKLQGMHLAMATGTDRWAYVEQGLMEAAASLERYDVRVEKVIGQGGAPYVLLQANMFFMTVSSIRRRNDPVRPSKFRDLLVDKHQGYQSNVLSLFPADFALPSTKYGIILHGPAETPNGVDRSRLGFIQLGFPRAKCQGYIDTPIDLLHTYNLSPEFTLDNNTVNISDRAIPSLRSDNTGTPPDSPKSK